MPKINSRKVIMVVWKIVIALVALSTIIFLIAPLF